MQPGSRVAGSIYEGFSPRGQQALAELRAELQAAGFYVEKERRTERSLRAYPERRWHYPLLNPYFVRSGKETTVALKGPSIHCPIYSDGDGQIIRLLQSFPALQAASYFPAPPRRPSRYFLHGYLVLPLSFVGEGRSQMVNYSTLRSDLSTVQLELSRVGF